MGTVSVNKLGGLSLAIGPVLALIFYFLQPGGPLIDTADPADGAATIGAMMANSTLQHVVGFMIPIGLIMFLYGIFALTGSIRDNGNGDALARYCNILAFMAVMGWMIGVGLSHVIASGNAGAAAGALYAANLGIGTMSSAMFGVAILLLSLGLSTRDDCKKMFALVIAALSVVSIVAAVVGGMDSSQLQTMGTVTGMCYAVTTVWFITMGMNLMKKS